jgi:hypothetical protein
MGSSVPAGAFIGRNNCSSHLPARPLAQPAGPLRSSHGSQSGLGRGRTEHHPPNPGPVRRGAQQRGSLPRAEGRPPGVADPMREPGSPANPDHPTMDPALHRPAVQRQTPHPQRLATLSLCRLRQPKTWRGHRTARVHSAAAAGPTAAGPVPRSPRRAARRRGAAASYSATFSRQCPSSSARSHSSSAGGHSTR